MKPHLPTDPAALRRAAVAQVKQPHATKPPLTKAEQERLQDELEVHHVELELQNENLPASQAKLQTSLERYTDFYDVAPVGYLTLGPDGEIRQLNPSAAQFLGAEPSRLLTRRLGQFVCLADRAAFASFLGRVFAGQSQACEVTLSESSVVVRIEAVTTPSRHECWTILTDITQRKRAEEAQRTARTELLSVIESTGDSIAMLDTEYRYTLFNSAFHQEFKRIFGQDLKRGDSMRQALAHVPNDLAEAMKCWNRALAGEDFTITQEFGHAALDRNWYELHFSPMRNQEGTIIGGVHTVRNVTGRKQVEDALRASEEQALRAKEHWEQTFDALPDLVCILDTQHTVVRANRAMATKLGLSSEGAIGVTCYEGVHGLQGPCDFCPHAKLLLDQKEHSADVYEERLGGHFFVTATPLHAKDGQLIGSVHVARDITERKRMEVALIEAKRAAEANERHSKLMNDKLNEAQQLAEIGSWDWDLKAETVWWSDETYRIFGVSPAEYVPSAEANARFYHPEDLEPFSRQIKHAFKTGELLDTDLRLVLRNGLKKHCHVRACVSFDTAEKPIRFAGTIMDVTARKQAEEALKASEARLKRAQQVARLGNWEWDLITKQLDWPEEIYRLHGLDPQKVKPSYEAFLQVIDPAELDFVKKTVAEALAGKSFCEFDYTVIRPDNGQRCVIHSKAEVILDDAGQAVKMVGTVQDITERKRLEVRAKQARKMEAIGHLAGGVAHEFNNILAAIMTGLELTKLSVSSGEDLELLEVMEASCHRAAGMVKQLLASSSQSMMCPQSLDLSATVAKELEGLRPLLGEGITLEFNRPPSVSRVWADKALVKEMVRGLCRNAQEAMPSGGVLRVELGEEEVGTERGKSHLDARAGRFVRLTVSDAGCGMDEQTLKRLFEPFFTTKDVVHGSGLSLAAAQGIVRQHGGWVEVESRVGQGSTFRVYLPVEVRKGDTTVLARPVTPALGSRGLILLAEDDESLRQLTQKFLVRLGYQVLEAADGAEALALWAAHEAEIDLIFTDMVMPGELSGLDVAQQAMAKKPGIKAIITSGYNTEKADLEAARTSGILCLPKPWVFKDLAEIVGVMLGGGVAPTFQSNAARI